MVTWTLCLALLALGFTTLVLYRRLEGLERRTQVTAQAFRLVDGDGRDKGQFSALPDDRTEFRMGDPTSSHVRIVCDQVGATVFVENATKGGAVAIHADQLGSEITAYDHKRNPKLVILNGPNGLKVQVTGSGGVTKDLVKSR
jgi:hypothetical protein